MSSQGNTKGKILKLIARGDNTLTLISRRLGLAPSTVSKHLHDMELSGEISQQENSHVKKWKYYRINHGDELEEGIVQPIRAGFGKKATALGALSIAFTLVALYAYSGYAAHSQSVYVPISITDPPVVPYGTQALYINYSSVGINESNGDSYSWVYSNSSGRLDLLSLVNASQIIGGATLYSNSTVKDVRFNISAASIVISNSIYAVYVPFNSVTSRILGAGRINSSSTVLLDFMPTVMEAYSQNNSEFVMVPSLRATDVWNGSFRTEITAGNYSYVSSTHPIPGPLPRMFYGQNEEVRILNATLSNNGTHYAFGIELSNIGNASVTLMGASIGEGLGNITSQQNHVFIRGAMHEMMGGDARQAPVFMYDMRWQSQENGTGPDARYGYGYEQQGNSTLVINVSRACAEPDANGLRTLNLTLDRPIVHVSIHVPEGQDASAGCIPPEVGNPHLSFANFIISTNGSMTLLNKAPDPRKLLSVGYVIPAHSNVTLGYSFDYPYGALPANAIATVTVMTSEGIVQSGLK